MRQNQSLTCIDLLLQPDELFDVTHSDWPSSADELKQGLAEVQTRTNMLCLETPLEIP